MIRKKFIISGLIIGATLLATFLTNPDNILAHHTPYNHTCTSNTWTIETVPTCYQYGSLVKQCNICGKTFDTKPIAKESHQPDKRWITSKEPTCLNTGTSINLCKICHNIVNTKKIPATGHHYKDNLCIDCGHEIYQDEQNHTLILSDVTAKKLNISLTGHVVIPEHVNIDNQDYTVIGIGYAMFYENKNITSITLPSTIKYIKAHAFDFCENLESCNLPDGLINIEDAAFQCCYKLKHITLPDSVESIGNFAFNHCSALDSSSFKIPKNIKKIGTYASCPAHMFYDCGTDDFTSFQLDSNQNGYSVNDGILYAENQETLVSIPRGKIFENNTYEIPNTIKHIGELSFSRNKNINTVIISDNLIIDGHMSNEERWSYNNIGNQLSVACYVYNNINNYNVRETNKHYLSIDGVLYTKDKTTLIAIPNQYTGLLNIPEGTTKWEYEALWTEIDYFRDIAMNKITKIHIPSTMSDIDKYQIEAINKLHDFYNTEIIIDSNNPTYTVSNGHIMNK